MDDLSVQIGERDGIVVDNSQPPDACAGQILQRWRTQAARADDKRTSGLELVLAGAADPPQDDLARVTLDLFA